MLFSRLVSEREPARLQDLIHKMVRADIRRVAQKILDYHLKTHRSYIDDFNLALLGPEQD